MVFHEDRDDVARRAYPRLAIGTLAQCLVLVGLAHVAGAREEMGAVVALVGALGVVALLIRGDVIALQLGRRISYEVHPDRLVVLRAGKVVSTVAFDDIVVWTAPRPVATVDYWITRGRCRSWGPPNASLERYSFTVRTPRGPEVVGPPALFRWEDRGGLDDLTQALLERIGKSALA